MTDSPSMFPNQEVIIDPLYEPLQLDRYELCPHFRMLMHVSHLRYGISPYLLFDVCKIRGILDTLKKIDSYTYENICVNFNKYDEKFQNIFKEYIKLISNTNKNIGDLYRKREEILACHLKVKEEYKQLNEKHGDALIKNFDKLSVFFKLEKPIKVKCPICEKNMFMGEEGKIYSIKEALLRTFELRRARWLQMSGLLHTVYSASTHTRLSHQIGSMIVAINALKEIDVYPKENKQMLLGEYLLMKDEMHEFLLANILHDVGHSPLSHVLEPNPFIELDHELITRNLISGFSEQNNGIDWYATERYLLKTKIIKNFEYKFFENIYDQTDKDEEFLTFLDTNDKLMESEIVTITEVLDNFGMDKEIVVNILDGQGSNCDIKFLNKFIDCEIDFDRIDHVKRDSVVCGLSLCNFKLYELLGSISVILPESDLHKNIYKNDPKMPYILISENGLLYIMDLLTSRKSVYKDILYSDANNWINGVVNQITAQAVRYLPHLTNLLPFITDQILMQFYTNDLFIGTQIEKLNKMFNAKVDYSMYWGPMRYKLRDDEYIEKKHLIQIYDSIMEINNLYENMDQIAVVFYMNIHEILKPKVEEPKVKEPKVKEKKWDDILIYKKKFYVNDQFQNGKYYQFKELAKEEHKYKKLTHERFPNRPSEMDVKNLFYFWICDFAASDNEDKKKLRNDVKEKIGDIWCEDNATNYDKISAFEKKFVNLNEIYQGDETNVV